MKIEIFSPNTGTPSPPVPSVWTDDFSGNNLDLGENYAFHSFNTLYTYTVAGGLLTLTITAPGGTTNTCAIVPVSIGFIKGIDQYSEVEFVSFSGVGIATGPSCFNTSRMNPATASGYCFQVTNAGGPQRSRLIRITNSALTTLQDTITGPPVAGDVYRLEARLNGAGVDLECFHNGGSVLTFNDPAPSAVLQRGIPGLQTRTSGAQVHNFTNLDCGAL
jgi:hypothetical protein